MSTRITETGPKLTDVKFTGEALMKEIGTLAITRITRRTRQGKGPNNATFQPLSPRYAGQKKKALGHSRADLQVSGRMLNDITIAEVTTNSVTLGFTS